MPAEFHFLRPEWLVGLALVPVALLLVARAGGRGGGWLRVVAPELRRHVLESRGGVRRRLGLAALVGLVLVAALMALAGPTWERQVQTLYRGGDALVVLLDLSRSMDTADLPPSRVVRARLKLLDLLERRTGGQTALIVYSANAFTVVPLTDDTDTIEAMVSSLSTNIMPSRGSYPSTALVKAAQLLEQAAVAGGRVLLIADGGYSEAALQAARSLRDRGFPVSVLGVGTTAGGPVPSPRGGFETDRRGKVAVAKLEEYELEQIAAAGGGRYARITADSSDLDRLLGSRATAGGGTDRGNASEQVLEIWQDQGPWIVVAMLPFAALLFRRGWLLGLAAAAVLAPPPVQALSLADLWARPDQQGARALDDGRPGEAAALFEDPRWRAAALYRDRQYEASAAALDGIDAAEAHYNRGNALARAGRIADAIAAYDATLALEPGHEDALFNKALLEQQQESQQQDGDGDSSSGQQGSDSGESGESGEDGAEGDQAGSPPPGSQAQGSDSSEADGDASGDPQGGETDEEAAIEELQQALRAEGERQDESGGDDARSLALSPEERERREQDEAMDQWLQRVPHDPGGLLRRKFSEQYRRQGYDQDGNSLWPDDEDEPW